MGGIKGQNANNKMKHVYIKYNLENFGIHMFLKIIILTEKTKS